MVIFSAKNLAFSYSAVPLFSGVTFDIKDNEKAALIGANGCGKSTLLSVLRGELSCDSGEVVKSADVSIGVMRQHISGDGTVLDEALTVFSELIQLEAELHGLHDRIEAIGAGSDADTSAADDGADTGATDTDDTALHALVERQSLLDEKFRDGGGLTYLARTKAALNGIGFDEAAQAKRVSNLSGGERSKLQLAKLLLGDDKLLFLDEPTNHLDINALVWLESFLLDCNKACIIVSHDRFFLDRVTTRTLELQSGRLTPYPAAYTKYLALKREREEFVQKKYYSDAEEIARIEAIIAQQKRFNQAHNYITIASKQKSIDRIREQLVLPPKQLPSLRFRFLGDSACATEVLVAKGLNARVGGRELFTSVDVTMLRGERVFLLGGNGCGKSTLFKLLLSKLDAAFEYGGEVRFGERVRAGYYDQQQQFADDSRTVLDETCAFLWDTDRECSSEGDARNLLGQFLFRGDDVYKKVGGLSGGEKARLILLKLSKNADNFLLLDEPTNHLDLDSRESLEKALSEFKGTMFIISHDRYLINKLATKIINIDNGKADVYNGDYTYFAQRAGDTATTTATTTAADGTSAGASASGVADGKAEYHARKAAESEKRKAQTRRAKLEAQIAALENEQSEITRDLAEYSDDYVKVTELSGKLAEVEEKLLSAMEELFGD